MVDLKLADIKQKILKAVNTVNEKNPYYLVIGFLVFVLALDYFLIMQFQLGVIRKLGPKIIEVKDGFEQFETNKARVGKYKKDIEKLDIQLAGLDERIRTTAEIPGVLEELSRIANRNKIYVEQILPDTNLGDPVLKNAEGKYYLLPVVVDAKSGYHDFGRFLNELEGKGALMEIDQMMISSNRENPRMHRIRLAIQTVIFETVDEVEK